MTAATGVVDSHEGDSPVPTKVEKAQGLRAVLGKLEVWSGNTMSAASVLLWPAVAIAVYGGPIPQLDITSPSCLPVLGTLAAVQAIAFGSWAISRVVGDKIQTNLNAEKYGPLPPPKELAASDPIARQAVVDDLVAAGKTVRPVREGEFYTGKILESKDSKFVVQELGRNQVAVHDRSLLLGDSFGVGQQCRIQYNFGKGFDRLQEARERTQSRSRGGIGD